MNGMDSPLDALALNYLSYGLLTAVSNIWAWIAVITAAFSFWKIRALSSPLVSRPEQRQDAASTSSLPPKMAAVEAAKPTAVYPGETGHLLSASLTTSFCVIESEGSPKGKFSLYYTWDDFRECDESGGEDEGNGGCNGGGAAVMSENLERRWDDWERMMVVRMGDTGWYRCQDLKVLDGSVVRLWDGGRRWRDAAAVVTDGGGAW